MKQSKKIEYVRPSKLFRWDKEESSQYLSNVQEIRKGLRALIAYQDSNDCVYNEDKITINNLLKRYGLANDRKEIAMHIMRQFVGDKMFFEQVIPIYEDGRNYSNRVNGRQSYSVADFFDIPTLYHYYKFRKAIIKKHKENLKSGEYGFDYKGFNDLVLDVKEDYFGQESVENMFFRQSDISLLDTPLSGYVNVGNLQAKFEKSLKEESLSEEELDDFRSLRVTDMIKGDVVRYMMSYVKETRGLTDSSPEYRDMIHKYSVRAISLIKNRRVQQSAEDYMLQHYDYGLTAAEVENIVPRTKESFVGKVEEKKEESKPSRFEYGENGEIHYKQGNQYTFFPPPFKEEEREYYRKK